MLFATCIHVSRDVESSLPYLADGEVITAIHTLGLNHMNLVLAQYLSDRISIQSKILSQRLMSQ